MKRNKSILFFVSIISLLLLSCSSNRRFTQKHYEQHEEKLYSIQQRYEKLYAQQAFQLDLKDKNLTRLGIELLTDSIKYIYNFTLDDRSFIDTLEKYGLDVWEMGMLIKDMQSIQATWISKLDYYLNREKRHLVFLSIRHKKLKQLLQPERYFTLAFFNRPQVYDKKGRLLDKDDGRRHRLINGEVFHRLNDRLFFAIMDRYR